MTTNDNAVRLFPVEEFADGTASDDTTIIDLERAERGRSAGEISPTCTASPHPRATTYPHRLHAASSSGTRRRVRTSS